MKEVCRKNGIARVHRTKLWFAFSGAHSIRKSAPEGKRYANLLQAAQVLPSFYLLFFRFNLSHRVTPAVGLGCKQRCQY
jgi:hypothetical protein